MSILTPDQTRVKAGHVENPYSDADFSRNLPAPTRMRPELVHPAVTPARDFPPIPADIRPLPCPDGHNFVPARVLDDDLDPTELRIVIWFGGEFFDGFPAISVPKGRVGEEIGPKIGRGVRTTEEGMRSLIRRGYFVARDQLHRDGMRTFIYAAWALRDELPELGGAPDRDDPACDVPHRPAFVLRQGAESCAETPLAARGADSRATQPEQAARSEMLGARGAENRPASAPGGAPVREIRAILDRLNLPIPETCASPPERPDPQPRNCAAIAQPGPTPKAVAAPAVAQSGVVNPGPQPTADPVPESAYVYGFNSPLPEEKTYTLADDERAFKESPVEQIFAYLALPNVYKSSLMYTNALLELDLRGIPWPDRYFGKTLLETKPPDTGPAVKRVAPQPGPAMVAKAEGLTLGQKVKQLAASGDRESVKALVAEFMERLGEQPKNRWSWNFHERNLKEVADGVMPPHVITDALEKFRSNGAVKPRCVFSAHVKAWRRKAGLYDQDERRAEERRLSASKHPAERG